MESTRIASSKSAFEDAARPARRAAVFPRRLLRRWRERRRGSGARAAGRGRAELSKGRRRGRAEQHSAGEFRAAHTDVDAVAHAGSFDYMSAVYEADICCGGNTRTTMGLSVQKGEVDRAIGLPLELLCDSRVVQLPGCAQPESAQGQLRSARMAS